MNPARRPEQSEKRYLAHVRQNAHGSFLIHELEEQVRGVARLSEEFVSTFGSADWGNLAGLWHDLGKYCLTLQRYSPRSSS
jgi:CRISPR-associated endonuclease/helicase Cas3